MNFIAIPEINVGIYKNFNQLKKRGGSKLISIIILLFCVFMLRDYSDSCKVISKILFFIAPLKGSPQSGPI